MSDQKTINSKRPSRAELLMPAGSLPKLKTAILYGNGAAHFYAGQRLFVALRAILAVSGDIPGGHGP